jgi:hypothetical protein
METISVLDIYGFHKIQNTDRSIWVLELNKDDQSDYNTFVGEIIQKFDLIPNDISHGAMNCMHISIHQYSNDSVSISSLSHAALNELAKRLIDIELVFIT